MATPETCPRCGAEMSSLMGSAPVCLRCWRGGVGERAHPRVGDARVGVPAPARTCGGLGHEHCDEFCHVAYTGE